MNIFKDTMSEMTYEQVEKLVEQEAIVLFPVGIIEEHGPHLPLELIFIWHINRHMMYGKN